MSKSKTSKNTTADDRAIEFGKNILHADGGKLFCTSCNVSLDHSRRATIQRHLESETHLNKKRAIEKEPQDGTIKKQKTISSMFKKTTESTESRHLATMELVEAFASANIPLEKLDHPKLRDYLQRNVKNAGGLPSANKLRQDYLPKVFDAQFEEVKSLINSCESFSIISDESTDEQDNYVLHVIFDFMSDKDEDVKTGTLTAVLADCAYLDAVNHTTVSQAIIKTLTKYGADFNKVSAFISDNATYMTKSYKSVLQGLMPNSVHITCNAHIISLVSELWRAEFPRVDKLVSYVKKIFKHCPSRKLRYRGSIAEKTGERVGQIALPPEPVITRWNSWFRAVQYHAAHLDFYTEFVEQELALTPRTQALTELSNLLHDPHLNEEVQFISKNATNLIDLITWFESRRVLIHKAYNRVMDLLFWAEAQVNETHSDRAELNASAHHLFSGMIQKIRQYYCYRDESNENIMQTRFKQPAAEFLKAVRIFDPAQILLLTVDLNSLSTDIPGFDKNCRLELPIYKHIAQEVDTTLPVLAFWKSSESRLPHLAKLAWRCLSIPTNSVDAERAVSKHGQVFSSQRQSMKPSTVAGCSMLTFNH